jgi:hypothetical protein
VSIVEAPTYLDYIFVGDGIKIARSRHTILD